MNPADLRSRLAETAERIEAVLDSLLADSPLPGELARPPHLLASMRYAMLGGGKRLRPVLVVESARLFGVEGEGVLRTGAAIECIHGYSLVHDDLPAMDDDDLRRGKPTVHKAFDEATAILAGDALMTLAFDVLADERTHPDPALRVALVTALARASGLGGMAGGQMLDLEAEGRFAADGKALSMGEAEILKLQGMKTGALLFAAMDMGAILGGTGRDERAALGRFGTALGRAFQIADDLLDAEGEAATVGKATGKDAAKGKATLVSLLGVDKARDRLRLLVEEADAALSGFGPRADPLRAIARFVADRQS